MGDMEREGGRVCGSGGVDFGGRRGEEMGSSKGRRRWRGKEDRGVEGGERVGEESENLQCWLNVVGGGGGVNASPSTHPSTSSF